MTSEALGFSYTHLLPVLVSEVTESLAFTLRVRTPAPDHDSIASLLPTKPHSPFLALIVDFNEGRCVCDLKLSLVYNMILFQ